MVRAMARRLVERALRKAGCSKRKPDTGPHTTWLCPCGSHTADIPRHKDISPGVVRDTVDRMKCLPEGWLQ
jgi:hypothetical protein